MQSCCHAVILSCCHAVILSFCHVMMSVNQFSNDLKISGSMSCYDCIHALKLSFCPVVMESCCHAVVSCRNSLNVKVVMLPFCHLYIVVIFLLCCHFHAMMLSRLQDVMLSCWYCRVVMLS